MKAHFLLYLVAFASYGIAIFLFILALIIIFVLNIPQQPVSTGYGYYTTPPTFIFSIPVFLISWAFFWGGVITAAFADLVRSSIRTSEILEERFRQRG